MPMWPRIATLPCASCHGLHRPLTGQSSGAITRTQLEAFTFDGQAIKLIDPSRGIHNPAMLPATLSILTNPGSGYQDQAGPDGFPRYSIRTGDWAHGDNRKLQAGFELEVPIIWLQTISPGRFVSVAPVYLMEADVQHDQYTLAISDELRSAFRSPKQLTPSKWWMPQPGSTGWRSVWVVWTCSVVGLVLGMTVCPACPCCAFSGCALVGAGWSDGDRLWWGPAGGVVHGGPGSFPGPVSG